MEFVQIKLKHDFDLNIIQYNNLYANSFRTFDKWKWSDWINKIQIPMIHTDKYKRGLVLYGDVEDEVSDGETIPKYRKDKNIINRNVISLDYDNITDFKGLYHAICNQLEGYSWAFHTTYSHTTEKPRIRLMVPLIEPVSADNYRKYSNALAKHIGYEVDEASFVPSQVMALPVKKDKIAVYMFKHNDAPAITIEKLEGLARTSSAEPIGKKNNIIKYPKRDSSHWREIAFGVGKGSRNNALPSIIGHLLRKGVDLNLVYGYAYLWGKACTPPLSDDRINRTVISIFKKHKSH